MLVLVIKYCLICCVLCHHACETSMTYVCLQMFNKLWSFIDEDNLGKMGYDKFRRIFMGEMSEPRKAEMKKVGQYG